MDHCLCVCVCVCVSHSAASRRRQRLLIGLCNMLILVFHHDAPDKTFDPGKAFTTRSISQEFLGAVSSTMTTRSLALRLLLVFVPLLHKWKILPDPSLPEEVIYCTCFHLLHEFRSPLWNCPVVGLALFSDEADGSSQGF